MGQSLKCFSNEINDKDDLFTLMHMYKYPGDIEYFCVYCKINLHDKKKSFKICKNCIIHTFTIYT